MLLIAIVPIKQSFPVLQIYIRQHAKLCINKKDNTFYMLLHFQR